MGKRGARVVVVGAGLGGLAAACHLAGRGHQVTVVEREASPGGLAGQWCVEGYKVDTGPSVLTMTGIVEETFAGAGAEMTEHLKVLLLDPVYRASFADGDPIYVRRGREAMSEEIRRACGAKDAAAYGRFCDWLGELYRLELPSFIARNYDSALDLARPVAPALRLAKLGGFRRVHDVVASYFKDPRLQKVFSFQALYAGMSPYDALAMYCVITYMDTVEGVWFVEGGVHALAQGLADAVEAGGGEIRYASPATRILRRPGHRGRVTGVRLADGEHVAADAVVCNLNLPVGYRQLLPEVPGPRVARRGAYSPSATLWLGAVRGEVPAGAAHHNIHFGAQWKESFEALLDRGVRQPDPSILVSLPALSDPSLAPSGGQVVYALEPVPNLEGHVAWDEERSSFEKSMVDRLGRFGYPVSEVVASRFIDPLDWEAMGMERGTPFSQSHLFRQTGPFRAPNWDRRVPGLAWVGAGTVPGVSVPMVLISGRLAAERVDQWTAEGRR